MRGEKYLKKEYDTKTKIKTKKYFLRKKFNDFREEEREYEKNRKKQNRWCFHKK